MNHLVLMWIHDEDDRELVRRMQNRISNIRVVKLPTETLEEVRLLINPIFVHSDTLAVNTSLTKADSDGN